MSVSCQPVDLADLAKCFECLTKRQLEQIEVYLLALKAGGSIDPRTLLALAKCFECLTPPQFKALQAYILCQIANGSTPEPGSTLLNNLIAYWRMEEASGNRLAANPLGPSLEPSGAPTSIEGKINNAAQFDPDTNDLLSSADALLETVDTDFTVTAWIMFDFIAAGGIIGRWSGADNKEWLLFCDGASFGIEGTADGFTVLSVIYPSVIETSQWYFVRIWFTKSDNLLHISIDNGIPFTVDIGSPLYDGTAIFEVGHESSGNTYFSGRIDEVGFWNRVLTDAEASTLFNLGVGTPYPWS